MRRTNCRTCFETIQRNADAHSTLGVLYKESGMHSRAISMLRKALELKNNRE
jgi:hypothetical protein